MTVVDGDAPSYNNLVDFERLLQTVTHIAGAFDYNGFTVPKIAVGVKHGNACGGCKFSLEDIDCHAVAAGAMMSGDSLAIFGGLVMTNFSITHAVATELSVNKIDGIMAPRFSPSAVETLKRRKGKCRFIMNEALETLNALCLDQALRFRYVTGGFLTQPNYTFIPRLEDPELMKIGSAHVGQKTDMLMAWAIGSTSNSNTITLVKQGVLIGNAVGQQDRVGAAELAVRRAQRSGHDIKGSVAYSDSFFPFPDGPEVLIKAGVSAIFTSSGSRNDKQTIKLCKDNNVTLYMIPDDKGRGFYGH